jgi:hypothetical protein
MFIIFLKQLREGILLKVRHYVTLEVILQLYYSLIYPFLTYGLLIWGNTYTSSLNPLTLLQKRAARTICFAKFDDHSSPFFRNLNLLKLENLIYVTNYLCMIIIVILYKMLLVMLL